jgi:hypothetical protein
MSTPVMTQAEAALHYRLRAVRHERDQCERLANISRQHIDCLLVAIYELSFPLLGHPEHGEAAGKAHDIATEIEDWWFAEESTDDDK